MGRKERLNRRERKVMIVYTHTPKRVDAFGAFVYVTIGCDL